MYTAYPRAPRIFLHECPGVPYTQAEHFDRVLREVVQGLSQEYLGLDTYSLRDLEASADRTLAFFDVAYGTSFSKRFYFQAEFYLGDVYLSLKTASLLDRLRGLL